MLRVHSIESFGAHEGPGIRLVIFLQGCLFRCLYCHNPDTWNICAGTQMTEDELIQKVKRYIPYFKKTGGVTVSGGEPLLQRKALIKFFQILQSMGIHTTLDTNGFILDEETKELLRYTNLVLLDVKHIDPQKHIQLTKSSNKTVLEFAQYCEKIKKPLWLRYVLVPGYTDQVECLHQWGEYFKNFSSVERVEVLPYHTFGVYKYETLGIPYHLRGVDPPTMAHIQHVTSIFSNYFTHVYVR